MLASDAQFESTTYVQQDQRGEGLSACNKRLGSNVLTRSFFYWRHLSIAQQSHPTEYSGDQHILALLFRDRQSSSDLSKEPHQPTGQALRSRKMRGKGVIYEET